MPSPIGDSPSAAAAVTAPYRHLSRRKGGFLVLALLALLAASVVGLGCGAVHLSVLDWWGVLSGDGGLHASVLWQLRLPRIVMALLVGWALGISGALCQALLRNPLASPFTLGVASGAGFGAVLVIVAGGGMSIGIAAAGAFGGAVGAVGIILAVARMRRASTETLILAGVAVMFFFSAATSFAQYLGTMEQVYEVVFWFFGSLGKVGWPHIGMTAAMVALPSIWVLRRAWDLNLVMTGDEAAAALGVDVDRLRLRGVVTAALMTAGAICFTGVIGFVGLVAPHITRMIIGSDHRYLLPGAGLIGALLMVCADTVSRTVWAPHVVPVGIVTAFLGVPFFFYLLVRRRREFW